MKCRSCGQTNQPENKFCGFCGTAMQAERRTEERRMIAWEPHQCRICGKTNPPENKFCGMCGAELQADRRLSERRTVQPKSGGPRSVPSITPPARTAPPVDDSNHVAANYLGAPPPSSNKPRGEWVRSSGSSFLGLEDGDEASSDSEYLLTDEEPRRGGGFRALIALAILVIVGYLVLKNWDSPTFAAAIAQIKKTSQSGTGATEPKAQTQPSTEQPSISTDENAASADAEKESKTQPQDAAKPQSQDNSQNDPTRGGQQEKSAAQPDSSANKAPEPATTRDEVANNRNSDKNASAIPEDDRTTDNADTPDAKESAAGKPKSPSASAAASLPAQDLYERGQAYLSGHGAPQSCDQGVVYTRAAAQQGNPKAAVQMGALYATGRCVSQDRVQAYNWFNEALRNEPNNEYVERSRSTLWAQMTSEERQRAAKQ